MFVEGLRTEEDYLLYWHRLHRTKVNVHIDAFRGAPRQLVERAALAKRKSERDERRGRGRAYDEVWCMFDIDEHPLLHEVRTMASDNGIGLAVSSPCIELWFLLHFADQTAHIERQEAQRRSAERLHCDKALSTDALEALEPRHPEARHRAQALDVKHEADGSPAWTNPSSSAWRIVDTIQGG